MSLGDYFKEKAIPYPWELLIKAYRLDPDQIYVTYFEGYAPSGFAPNDEARELGLDIGAANDHILPSNMEVAAQ